MAIFLFTILLASPIIRIVFGSGYLESISVLRVLSLLFLINPISGIVSVYLLSMKRPGLITISRIISTVLNVFLNFILVSLLVSKGEIYALYGAATATIISNFVYLTLLFSFSKSKLANTSLKARKA